jgi:hypothetical protein
MGETNFHTAVAYLKYACIFGALFCFVSILSGGFDPWHSLDALVWRDLYGSEELPAEAKPAFRLIFMMFAWLSVIAMCMMFMITKYAIIKKEKWAFVAVALQVILWPAGACAITLYTGAYHYFISVGAITFMLLPPLLMLYPYFRNKETR